MRVAVIGGGVVGLCSAHALARKGMEVVVFDPEEGPRTSTMNAGMIVPSHVIPLAAPGMAATGLRMMLKRKGAFRIRPRLDRELLRWLVLFARHCTREHVNRSKGLLAALNQASKHAYIDFESELPGFKVHRKGLLMVANSAAGFEEERKGSAEVAALGMPVREVAAAELRSFDPGVEIEGVGAIHYADDCHIDPGAFVGLLRTKLAEMGVVFERRRILEVADARADQVVVATGSWSRALVLPLRMPLLAGKGYSFDIPAPPERPTIPALLTEGRVAVTPMPNGVRFGGTMEIGIPDERVDRRRVEGIREAIPRYYPAFSGFDWGAVQLNVGLRPCSPDGLPYVGRIADDVIVATGHAMMGMSLGPITGRIVAEIAANENPSIAIDLLRPDRFSRASKLPA